MKVQAYLLSVLLAATLGLTGCHIHIDDTDGSWSVNGVRLEEEHVDRLEILAWDEAGLEIQLGKGDVRIESTSGRTEIEATLRETMLNDASLEYRGGKLTCETKSGEPAAISDLVVRVNGSLPALKLTTGAGDISLDDVVLSRLLRLSTGAGDVSVSASGEVDLCNVRTGAGDIRLSGFSSQTLTLHTGAGDLSLRDLSTARAELESGVGDIRARGCKLGVLTASSGIGDIDVSDSSYDSSDLSSSIGDIHRADR